MMVAEAADFYAAESASIKTLTKCLCDICYLIGKDYLSFVWSS
jgi:hypothetical protein